MASTWSQEDFNPRSRKGSDSATSFTDGSSPFQSTLPQGERHCGERPVGRNYNNFNPRSRKGSDHIQLLCAPFRINISIHAPARGATAILAKNFSHFLFTFPNSSPILHFNYHCFMAIPFDPPFFHTLLCTFSGANLPGFLCELQVRTRIFLTESRLSAFSPVISDRDTFRFSNRSLTATVSMLTS